MRALVDLVDSFTGMVRFIIVAMMLVGLAIGLMLTAGVSYVAPKVAEGATERAAKFGELAMEEARSARRERDMAKNGWGYGSTDDGGSSQGGSAGDGWGDE